MFTDFIHRIKISTPPFFSFSFLSYVEERPQEREDEEIECPIGKRDQIKFIDLGFERW